MKWLLRIALALAAVVVGAAFWLLETEAGLRWALGFAPPQLAVENPRGALAREMRADRIAWEGLEARQVRFEVNLLALVFDTVSVNFVRIDSLAVKLEKR
jgi:autotransporter translocation and assembly factor TamB